MLLLFLFRFVFGGMLGPVFGTEDVPIDGVSAAGEFVEGSELDVLWEADAGGLEPSRLAGFWLQPLINRLTRDESRSWRTGLAFFFVFAAATEFGTKVSSEHERSPHQRRASGIIRGRFLAQRLWQS